MSILLPTQSDTSTSALLSLTLDHIDGWGWVYLMPPAELKAEGPHCIPPRLVPTFLQLIGKSELGLAGETYTIRVDIFTCGFGQKPYKLSGDMEGLQWWVSKEAALAALKEA